MIMRNRHILLLLLVAAVQTLWAQTSGKSYDSYRGLVMAGYQGWFSTPDDGGDRGWYHYQGRSGEFKPGATGVEMWPDVSEYEKTYESPFSLDDGKKAHLFSPRDYSTVDTHFRWMKEYGVDGVFMQRFVVDQKWPKGKAHHDTVLDNAMRAARKYERAVCIMYDLTGMKEGDEKVVLSDIQQLARKYSLFDHSRCPSYLYHRGKPLVAVYGVGFNDGRKYGFPQTEAIIRGLKQMGYSIMVSVPGYWRTLNKDTENDVRLHQQIKMCDILLPWYVGRYNEQTFPAFQQRIIDDMRWAKANNIDFAPLCFPGFSWHNLHYPQKGPGEAIPRNKGSFYKKQLNFCVAHGAEMIYIAMFDEIDEGTAIFKIARKVPTPARGSNFVPLEKGVKSDHYLKLTGKAAKKLKKKLKISR